MMRRNNRFLLGILLLLLAGCSNGGDSDSGGLLGLNSGPTPVVSLDSGLQVANTFLEAWKNQDYNTMYGQISPNARDAYSQENFTETYISIWEDLQLQNIDWTTGQSVLQGTTAIIQYDVTFRSEILGEFTDPARLIRIIPTDEGMRIAWSRMDIFEGWAGGARLRVEQNLANRGNIYDSQGRALADQNGVALPLYVSKNGMGSVAQCITELVPVLGREADDLQATFDSYYGDTLFLVGEIDTETYQERGTLIDSACRPTIGQRPTRRYFASAAPHVVGYVGQIPAEQEAAYVEAGYPKGSLVGNQGVELEWEEELRGTIGNRLSLYSPTDELLRVITERRATPGQSLYLTLDRDLQQGLNEAFANAYSLAKPTWGDNSRGAAAVIIDVRTGAILGMVSFPTFDPAVFSPDNPYMDSASVIASYYNDPRTPLLNRPTQGAYPLGSVFKLVSSIAGANSGIVPLTTTNVCTGTWYGENYNDVTRTDWYKPGHGLLDGFGAIINSCNPYYWELSVKMNNSDPFLLPQYARTFGFGSTTGLRGVVEGTGSIPDPSSSAANGITWGQANASNLVIGQGEMQVTPIQVARMIAAIATDGKLLSPYLVEKVQLIGEEPSFTAQPQYQQLDIDPQVLADVRQAMCDVTTTSSGTANFIFQEWYEYQNYAVTVCGKTGTAQSGAGTEPHAWFAAFAPADDPEIAVAVIVENSCEGSEVAAPIVRRILELYFGLPEFGFPPLWQSGCSEIVIQ